MSQATLIPSVPTSPIFNFKNCEIRTIMQDGQPWFVARDVCAALGITWSGATLKGFPQSWSAVLNLNMARRGGDQIKPVRIISEPAVYKLAFRSNKPEADEFTNWVASDVLPAIRKTGKFDVAEKPKRGRKALGTGVPAPALARDPLVTVEQRIIALHAHVVKERHTICVDMGLAVWQTYGGDVLATMFHAIYTCVDKAIIDPSASLSSYDLPVDLARRIAGLKVSASGAKMQGA